MLNLPEGFRAVNPADCTIDPTEMPSAEDRAMVENATSGQVLTAIHLALDEGEMEAVVDLLGILARKDPRAADLIVKTIQYQSPGPWPKPTGVLP